jgi:hypothetical protein
VSATKPAPETTANTPSQESAEAASAARRAPAEIKAAPSKAQADAGDVGAPAILEFKKALGPLCSNGNGKGALALGLLKDLIMSCDDTRALQEIREFARRRLNTLDKQQKRIRHATGEVRKVDKYTYRKKQTKEGSPSYWYIFYTQPGTGGRRSRTVGHYLGKDMPTFKPEVDLKNSRSRRAAASVRSPKPVSRVA